MKVSQVEGTDMTWKTSSVIASASVIGVLSLFGAPPRANAAVHAQLPSMDKRISMTLNEWKIKAPKEVGAGKVTISVRNTGKVEHELVLLRTDLKPSQIRIDKKTDRFNEEAPDFTSPGEINSVKAGKSKTASFDLAPGHYIFVCNLVGHFRQGMYKEITVK
jgi:uncharacterized cupredoxin-like copper-binding protein